MVTAERHSKVVRRSGQVLILLALILGGVWMFQESWVLDRQWYYVNELTPYQTDTWAFADRQTCMSTMQKMAVRQASDLRLDTGREVTVTFHSSLTKMIVDPVAESPAQLALYHCKVRYSFEQYVPERVWVAKL